VSAILQPGRVSSLSLEQPNAVEDGDLTLNILTFNQRSAFNPNPRILVPVHSRNCHRKSDKTYLQRTVLGFKSEVAWCSTITFS